jgi:hypothetical protein
MRREDGQGAAAINPVWKILWKLEVPSKAKNLFGELYTEWCQEDQFLLTDILKCHPNAQFVM